MSLALFNPYPGLRPFRETEAHLFFGRRTQTDELIARLERSRFVAVMGPSGSGKSSLVRAGLFPALHGGFSPRGSYWQIATFRPGGNPIGNLARALAVPDIFGAESTDQVMAAAQLEATLRRSGLGLADAARRETRLDDARLLVVADQFEELFRFQASDAGPDARADSAALVQLLIEASRADDAPVDVILTMRSDFLGDCAQFRDLPERISEGLYLVPRMTRTQLREAVAAPALVGGGAITSRLVQRVLNDAGTDPDVLPVVQHALMRTWDLWARDDAAAGPVDLEHYQSGGGLEDALGRHADETYNELGDNRRRQIAELMFKRLTELGADRREIRRPSPLNELVAVADATPEEVTEVISLFQQPGTSFVTVTPDKVVDISHESLIRQWPRLRRWVREEVEAREFFWALSSDARAYAAGEASLLRGRRLRAARRWWTSTKPSEAWASRYARQLVDQTSDAASSVGVPQADADALTIDDQSDGEKSQYHQTRRFLRRSVGRRRLRIALLSAGTLWVFLLLWNFVFFNVEGHTAEKELSDALAKVAQAEDGERMADNELEARQARAEAEVALARVAGQLSQLSTAPLAYGLTVSEALSADATGILPVRGFIVDDGDEARLCELLVESRPPQCGGASLVLTRYPDVFMGLSDQGVTWTDRPVVIVGELTNGTFDAPN